MHVECNRVTYRANAARLSRHWYDLARLADMEIGRRALSNRTLLADVVKHKKVFFNSAQANYDACLAGQLRLLPNADVLSELQGDFDSMVEGGMFVGEAPAFESIIERLRHLEIEINT